MKGFRYYFAAALVAIFLSLRPCSADTNSAAVYLTCLTNFETYAETIWHAASGANVPTDSGYFGDGGSGGNGGIRGSTGVAVAYAVMAQALPSDPRRPTRIARIRQALNYAANTHVSGTNVCIDGLQWGHDWQTAMWAAQMGFACQLVQNDLPPSTVAACQRALADEATYRAGIAPASGYVGDTKAEENAWDSNVLALGAAWLSTNGNAPAWLIAAKKYLANTYTVANTNGDPLASWITTVTLYPDFELQNHGYYYPVYQMVAGMSLGDSLLMARLSNPSVAAQLQPFAEHNVLAVWNPLSLVQLDSGDFVYPAGLDWTLHDYEQNSYMAWVASHFNDPKARWADTQLVKLVRSRQQLNGDGRFIGPSETDTPFYREAVEAYRTGVAYLQHVNADYTNGPMTAPAAYSPQLFADVGLIEQRGAAGYFSLSFYGSQVMGIIAPPAISIPSNCFLVTPKLPGVIGLGALGNPTGAKLVSFATNVVGGFDAELQVTNGLQGTTEVYVKSTGESVGIVEVPWPASGATATTAGSFVVGVENQPLTGGTRLLEWAGGSAVITNRSGVSQNISNQWLCVDGEYGMIAGPSGYFSYQAASSYNILGAAQDTLQFMPAQKLGPRYCVWFPGKNAAITQSNAANLTWTNSGTNATLIFPGSNGPNQISVVLPPPQTAFYQPYALPIASITASSSQSGFPPTLADDGDPNTFWVSSGTSAGQGPTTNHPEWLLVTFPRQVAVSEFKVAPRTTNGGYGPKNVQVLLNGVVIYQGTMAATATLDVTNLPPIYATNAELLITSSYDPNFPTNSRNVQVVELTFFERGQPGTFEDWAVHQFTAAQLADPSISGPMADPDGDGVPNLAEFAVGGNPMSADPSNGLLQHVPYAGGTFVFSYRERQNLGNVTRFFESSPDLVNWSTATPSQNNIVANLGNVYVRDAFFPEAAPASFYRVRFQLNPAQ